MQCITTFYVPFHTRLGIIKSTSLPQQLVSESRKRWGRRQYKVGVNRPIYLHFSRRLLKVGVKTRKYVTSIVHCIDGPRGDAKFNSRQITLL